MFSTIFSSTYLNLICSLLSVRLSTNFKRSRLEKCKPNSDPQHRYCHGVQPQHLGFWSCNSICFLSVFWRKLGYFKQKSCDIVFFLNNSDNVMSWMLQRLTIFFDSYSHLICSEAQPKAKGMAGRAFAQISCFVEICWHFWLTFLKKNDVFGILFDFFGSFFSKIQ